MDMSGPSKPDMLPMLMERVKMIRLALVLSANAACEERLMGYHRALDGCKIEVARVIE
jgi:hypothetical protein